MRPLWLLFALVSLLAADGGCFRFFKGSYLLTDGHPAYAVADGRFVAFYKPSNHPVLTHDPLIGLYLFKAPTRRPFLLSRAEGKLTYCYGRGESEAAKLRSYPVALRPGRLANETKREGALFTSCCRLAGVVGPGGIWWGRSTIRRLLAGDTRHGDIGLRFEQKGKKIVVTAVDPFAHSGVWPGDRVTGGAKEGRLSLKGLLEQIDGCREGESVSLRFKKGGVKALRCFERFGGGVVSDTFLERFGIYFDPSLKIVRIVPGSPAQKRGLKAGDRLLMIDGKKCGSWGDVREILSGYAKRGELPKRFLWERNDFQFFLRPFSL